MPTTANIAAHPHAQAGPKFGLSMFSFFELKYTHFSAHPDLNYRARFQAAREMRNCIGFAVAFGLVLSNESLADKFTS